MYDSEALAFEGRTERHAPYDSPPEYKTVAECQRFVDEVVASGAWRHLCPFGPDRVTVVDGRGRRRAGASGNEVAMPKFTRRRWYLLHELAHVATGCGDWALVWAAPDWAPHGPEYVAAYLYLVSEFLSPEQHAALVSAMASRRVKVCVYLGGGVYDGTTLRRVTAIDAALQPGPRPPHKAKIIGGLHHCDECGMQLPRHHRGRFCSDGCRWTFHNHQRHKRSAAARVKVCEVCGETFTPSRSDAKTCSDACRQKAYRQRARA